MAEDKKNAGAANPFDEANFYKSAGLYQGIHVITRSVVNLRPWLDAEQKPVIGRDGKPLMDCNWEIGLISEENGDVERRLDYNFGLPGSGALLGPTADSKGVQRTDPADKRPIQFHPDSDAAKAAKGLKAGGFDIGKLFPGGQIDVTGIVGARIELKGEAIIDFKTKKPKMNKKGYAREQYYPVKFYGFKAGTGGGAAGSTTAARDEAAKLIDAALADGTSLTKVALMPKLAQAAAGSPNLGQIIGLLGDPSFVKPWSEDGLTFAARKAA